MIAKTKVCEIKVYRKSATVFRSGSVNLKAGANTIYIAGMTQTCDNNSFVVKFPEKVSATNIQVVGNDAVKDITPESERIAKEIAELSYRIEVLNSVSELRKTNGNFTYRTNVSAEEQESYMKELSSKLLAIHDQVNELNAKKEELAGKLEEAESDEEKPLLKIDLNCEEENEYPFILQYQENSCSWFPKYEVRFNGDDKPLEANMKACIKQSSKEDWENIKVTLYTGNPSASQEIPSLASIQLSLIDEEERARRSAAKASAVNADMMMGAAQPNMMAGMMMAATAPMMMNMQTAQAEVSEEETMTAFALADLRDIISDTDGNIATLQTFSVDASYGITCIPSVTDKCFMSATIKTADWPLGAARASIYLNDIYSGNVYVDPDSDDEEFTISLGQDERINIIRESLPDKTQNVMLKNQKKRSYSTRIKVSNKSGTSLKVLIKEAVPVSLDKAIIVELNETSNGEFDEETGIIKWSVDIDPQSTETINLAYNVLWPKDKRYRETRKTLTSKAGKKYCPTCGSVVTGTFCPECGSSV